MKPCLLVAAALIGLCALEHASGVELRQEIQQDLRLNSLDNLVKKGRKGRKNKTTKEPATPAESAEEPAAPPSEACQPDTPSEEDRVCENVSLVDQKPSGCVCAQKCDVWGDPHVATFYSKCTNVVMTEPGNYTYWELPANNKHPGLSITVEVEKRTEGDKFYKNKPWIRKAYIDGQLVMNAETCSDETQQHISNYHVWSDNAAASNANEPDVSITLYIGCRKKKQSHGVKQLYLRLSVDEEDIDANSGDAQQDQDLDKFPYPSTEFFSGDFGICTDPVKYGYLDGNGKEENYKLACQRQSEFKSAHGRQCACGATCGAFGDPYLTNFHRMGCRSTNARRGCNFQMPKKPSREESIMYAAQNQYATEMILDECEFIIGVNVWIMKEDARKRYISCSKNAGDVESLTESDFDIYTIMAEDECEIGKDTDKFHEASQTYRKAITIPSRTNEAFGSDHYDDLMEGYKLGRSVLITGDSGDKLVPVPEGVGLGRCLEDKGEDPTKAAALVDMGGIVTILKCHVRKGRAEGTQYFNACVQRQGTKQEEFDAESLNFDNTDVLKAASYGDDLFNTMEAAGQTSGWCATGDFDKDAKKLSNQIAMSTKSYEERKSTQVQIFPMVDQTNAAGVAYNPDSNVQGGDIRAQPASSPTSSPGSKRKGRKGKTSSKSSDGGSSSSRKSKSSSRRKRKG